MDYASAFQYVAESQLLSFYGWWQASVCLFAFAGLMAIWWHIGKSQHDLGQVWLALSVLCWSFSGAAEVYFARQFQQESHAIVKSLDTLFDATQLPSNAEEDILQLQKDFTQLKQDQLVSSFHLDGWRSILSLFNSLFILLALPWFRYIPKRISPVVKSKLWPAIIGLPFLFSLLPTISKMITQRNFGLISELDVYYAMLTLTFLGFVLWESFEKRRLPMLAWLSTVCIIVTLVAQLYKLTDSQINLTLLSAIFKTSLIMIFFALALSWVKELTGNLIPEPQHLFLSFELEKNEQGKYEHLVLFKGLPSQEERKIQLTPAHYNLCLEFAKRRIVDGEDWLEIKPKYESRTSRNYDIKDHNEIKRLLTALLDGIFGKGNWTKDQHQQPLKETLFEMSEKRERKIRLRIPAENISIEREKV